MNTNPTTTTITKGLVFRMREVPELTCVLRELAVNEDAPLALDPDEVARFVSLAMRKVGRSNLALSTHGFFLHVDPLVLLVEGRAEHVKRTACIPLCDGTEVDADVQTITFPATQVLETVVPDQVPLDEAVGRAMKRARAWAMSDPEHRLGTFVRLHLIPDGAGSATTVIRIERLRRVEED